MPSLSRSAFNPGRAYTVCQAANTGPQTEGTTAP